MRKDVIYDLLDRLGGEEVSSQMVLAELIQWLPAATVVEFVDDFKRIHSIMGYEEHELCYDCQESYDSNEEHSCDKSSQLMISEEAQ